jgi:DNA-binding response OmpR family regulator
MYTNKNILVVDDERHIVDLVRLYLTNEGFNITGAYDGEEALRAFATARPALVVLDLMLPRLDGWEVCRRIRRESDVPIIMLTARGDDIDKIVGLELGADDYLTKPFNPRELVARVRAILRRSGETRGGRRASGGARTFGNTTVDEERHEVTVDGRPVSLRSKEFDLLLALVDNIGRVLARDTLLNTVWGYDYFGDTRTVDVHVAHLRDRLAGSSLSIETIRGLGYKLLAPGGEE